MQKGKFFIVGFYSDLNCPFECFRACELYFNSFQDCVEWIDFHKKYFSPLVSFGIFSIDNSFDVYGNSVESD